MVKVDILGVCVDQIGIREAQERFLLWLAGRHEGLLHQAVTVNPEFIMEAQKNTQFRNVLNNASLALADGVGLVFASVFLYGRKRRLFRMTGVECVVMLARLCVRTGNTIYLLGAEQGIAERVAETLKRRHPALRIAGAEEGISKETQRAENEERGSRDAELDKEICKRIVDSRTDVLLVAFGAPKQDLWIARNAVHLSGVRIAVGVGGAFDYIASAASYAPQWVRSVGFEWAYRLITQPDRWRRIVTAVICFPFAVLIKKCHSEAKAKNPDDSRDPSSDLLRPLDDGE